MNFKSIYMARLAVLLLLILWWAKPASAVKFEFSAGFAYNHPTQKPLPGLSDGYGYNFNACLWVHHRVGLGIGAMGTRHEFDAGTRPPNQSVSLTSNEGLVYVEGRYKLLVKGQWEIAPVVGASAYNTIDGGDFTGSQLSFEDYPNYNNEDIGYTGAGYWLGLSIYREIRSYNRGYFVYLNTYYNFLAYSKHQSFTEYTNPSSGITSLVLYEEDTNRPANMLVVSVGIAFRFDFSNF